MADNNALQAGLGVMRKLFGRKPDKGALSEVFFNLTIAHVYGHVSD